MKVMILAAGRGERMRQLTDNCPKPLLKIAGRSIIEHLILALKKQGFDEFVINIAYLGQQIKRALGSGEQWGVQIEYSDEGGAALETGGGIFKALPLLGNQHFLVVNADVWTDFPYNSLMTKTDNKTHLVLINNPPHHPDGDFSLNGGLVVSPGDKTFTYSGIGVFHPAIFAQEKPGAFPLAPIIRRCISKAEVNGELYEGEWVDVGTPERLAHLATMLKA
ncbi:MAG: nucleotidyltransferase family protein [Cycloclasticus sp.]|nr:nucleotidyltransferase family protein [Cycloclasticus sp.]